jgi:NAD(P)-dependent dehydrogenase (short-subunit alcohol dehydrogenase family)
MHADPILGQRLSLYLTCHGFPLATFLNYTPTHKLSHRRSKVKHRAMNTIFILLFGQCCCLSASGFSHVLAYSKAVSMQTLARRRATTTAFLPRQRTPDDLDRESTANDVLHLLHQTEDFAPYVGPQGTAVVTGGTGGIGLPAVEALARTGMKIVLCAKDASLAKASLDDLSVRSSVNLDRVRIQQVDLSDLNSIQDAMDQIVREEKRVDVLLNCAGVNSVPERTVTAQNFEQQMGVNHIGHFFLTRGLLPYMSRTGRVVMVSSKSHAKARSLDIADLNSEQGRYSPFGVYCKSKLANILFASGLQDKLRKAGSDIKTVSCHPGRVMTKLWRHADADLIRSLGDYIAARTPEQGAATLVYSCLVNSARLDGDDYLIECKPAIRSDFAQDINSTFASDLWEKTESLIRDSGFRLPQAIVPGAYQY